MRNALAATSAAIARLKGAISVAAAAYGRHQELDAYPRDLIAIGSEYQLAHAVAPLGLACLAEVTDATFRSAAGLAVCTLSLGTLFFSGSLYALAVTGTPVLEGLAPIGGFLIIVGWLSIGWIGAQQLIFRPSA